MHPGRAATPARAHPARASSGTRTRTEERAFDLIFTRVVASKNMATEPDSSQYLRKLCLRDGRTELRACYPSDICNILISIGKYEDRPPCMSKTDLERAAGLYFAKT